MLGLLSRANCNHEKWFGMPKSEARDQGLAFILSALYSPFLRGKKYIRPQGEENRASRPLSRTQASRRLVSSMVGDHMRIPAVVCFFY